MRRTFSRVLTRSIEVGASFDGTTGETATGYQPLPTQNGRSFKAAPGRVGRWGFGAQGRKGNGPALFRIRVWGTIGVNSRVEVRTGLSGDAPAGDRANAPVTGPVELAAGPQDVLIETFTLTNTWSQVYRLGPTDAICVFHTPAQGEPDTVEIEVIEGDAESLAVIGGCSDDCAGCCEATNVPIELADGVDNADLEPWECFQNFLVTVEESGATLTLPPIGGMATGAAALVSRRGGAWFKVISADGINGLASPEGVTFTSDAQAVLFQVTNSGWSATDAYSNLVPALAPPSIPPFGGTVIRTMTRDITVLPETTEIAPGQELVLTNARGNGLPTRIILFNPPTENINGEVGGEILLPNINDTVRLVRDGATGWRMTWSLFGRYEALVATVQDDVFLVGWPGTRTRQYTSVAPNVNVTLPGAAGFPRTGSRLHAFRSEPGTITFDAGPGGLIIGDGVAAQTLVVGGANIFHLLEYEGSGVWSYSKTGTSQDRRLATVTTINTPQTIAALTSDVTIVSASSDAAANVLDLPSLATTALSKILRIFNTGTANLIVRAVAGQGLNGPATNTRVLTPGTGITLQPFNTTYWHVTP